MTTYTVPRGQGTYADTLMALGLGRLLKTLNSQGEVRIHLAADQDAFTLDISQPVLIEAGTAIELYDYIKTERDNTSLASAFDYEREKERRQQFFKWRENNKKTPMTEVPESVFPRPDYSLYSSLVDMLKPMDTSGYATAHRELASERFCEHVKIALDAFDGDGSPLSKADAGLKIRLKGNKFNEVSVVQIFNPVTGKGMNAPKPNSIGMGQEKAPLILEALKYTGWFIGAVAVTPKGSKDLKVLVVQPADIELETLRQIMTEFRQEFMGGGAIQLDILAALTLTETLLRHDEHKTLKRGRPKDILSGFQTAYFQNLGSAKGVTNISFIALPSWVRLADENTEGQRKTWLAVLEEHRRVIRNLDESHSEERHLLEQYRDFLSGQDVHAFLEFLSNYGPHALRLADRGKFVLWMTTENLGRVLGNMEHAERNNIHRIITDAGFQSVAGAIRRATRSSLYAKKLQNDRTYDIHYGLAQDLKRSAVTKTKFMAALSDFVAEYMNENLRAADRGKRGRAAVTTEDLLSVGILLDNNDPQMVAMLLIAYGYAKEPKEETGEAEPTPADDVSPESNQEEQA
ncbi:hypothetical protein [Deinococcus alpinitundrae]|uniref:hypothetical protein n=1 Tax=Deinococcus alpinitundrae TaxID=468913 RepID=UPI001ED930AF|nr:hypothetical protein [Deinococcus alpinitundrae]